MSNHEEYNIKFLKRVLSGVKFHYDGPINFNNDNDPELGKFNIVYEVTDIIDIKKKYWMGDPITIYYVNVKIVDGDEKFVGLCNRIIDILGPNKIQSFLETHFSVLMNNLGYEVHEYLHDRTGLGRENYRAKIEVVDISLDLDNNTELNEAKMNRLAIRTIIKDIVKILKTEGEGMYNLPEDIGEEMTYDFVGGPNNITVELELRPNEKINTFLTNGTYVKDEDVVEILITYNPNKDINKMLYDIIGELNDIVAHELEHYFQYNRNEFDFSGSKDDDNPLAYYTKPYEVKAQVKGFKRLSKIRRIPLETTIRNWFETHKDIHQLNDKDSETVINTLLQNV